MQEQPLLLEDLLEQEKREQEKQLQNQPQTSVQEQPHTASNSALLTDQDFEKLRPDVFRTVSLESPPQGLPGKTNADLQRNGFIKKFAFQRKVCSQPRLWAVEQLFDNNS